MTRVYCNDSVQYLRFIYINFAAIQKKPIGESRTPTDFWSGLGFSKSMPESAIRERMQQTGVRQKYEPPMATTYEVSIKTFTPPDERRNLL